MKVNPTEASQIAGVTRKTLYADMQKGTLSYGLTDKKKRLIHVAELERVYGTLAKPVEETQQTALFETSGNTAEQTKNRAADAEILRMRLEYLEKERNREREQLSEQIEHLRGMLSTEQEERRNITLLLTNQTSEREKQGQKQEETVSELDTLKKTVLELRKQNRSIFRAFKEEKEKTFWQKLFG
tara:strand:+ start:154075 stop:154629 length:555 start_codon:yes stop_codon:yes gene_type:complete